MEIVDKTAVKQMWISHQSTAGTESHKVQSGDFNQHDWGTSALNQEKANLVWLEKYSRAT